jgi:hypothetical protein
MLFKTHKQTGSRNMTGPKTLPTIWGTYMKIVTKYQISAINSCWEKCDEKCAYMFIAFFSVTVDDFWSQASFMYTILWVAFLDLSDSYSRSSLDRFIQDSRLFKVQFKTGLYRIPVCSRSSLRQVYTRFLFVQGPD